MQITRLIIFFLSGFLLTLGCTNNSEQVVNHKDSLQYENDPADSSITDYESCYEDFFKGLPRFKDSASAYLLLENGSRQSLTQFFKDEFLSPVSQYGIKDLDIDGVMDLIIFNYTGGPHCCDEYYIFRQKNELEFEYKAHIMGGHACIDAANHNINYSFSETLGYFFSCYACEFVDSSGNFKSMREIQLKYRRSKLEVMPYDADGEKQNLANLQFLQQHGYEKLEELMDSGWRKEFAMSIAVWHYNHGKDWKSTKALFDKYYNFQDASKVWNEFYRSLIESAKQNSF